MTCSLAPYYPYYKTALPFKWGKYSPCQDVFNCLQYLLFEVVKQSSNAPAAILYKSWRRIHSCHSSTQPKWKNMLWFPTTNTADTNAHHKQKLNPNQSGWQQLHTESPQYLPFNAHWFPSAKSELSLTRSEWSLGFFSMMETYKWPEWGPLWLTDFVDTV